jgi:hypothetical protein
MIKRSDCRCLCHTDYNALGLIEAAMHVIPCCEPDPPFKVELDPAEFYIYDEEFFIYDEDILDKVKLKRTELRTLKDFVSDQSHLDSMDTDGRHKWLALFRIPCKCKECRNEQDGTDQR